MKSFANNYTLDRRRVPKILQERSWSILTNRLDTRSTWLSTDNSSVLFLQEKLEHGKNFANLVVKLDFSPDVITQEGENCVIIGTHFLPFYDSKQEGF